MYTKMFHAGDLSLIASTLTDRWERTTDIAKRINCGRGRTGSALAFMAEKGMVERRIIPNGCEFDRRYEYRGKQVK